MINNRQAGRRRGRGGNGQRPGGNPGRPDSGNRIDNRARGNANQLYEKYKNLARDAQMQGDRVNTEYYLQFMDHYFRVLSESRSRFEDQNQRRQRDDNFVNGFDNDIDGDDEYGDEGEPIRAGEQSDEPQRRDQGDEPRRRDGAGRDRDGGRDRDVVARDAGRDNGRDRGGDRDNGRDREVPRDHSRRETRSDEERRPAANQARGNDDGNASANQPEVRSSGPAQVANDLDGDRNGGDAAAEPRRRGRPRRERVAAEEAAPAAIEADRLPPALSAGSEIPSDAGERTDDEPKPRRRRTRTVPSGEASSSG